MRKVEDEIISPETDTINRETKLASPIKSQASVVSHVPIEKPFLAASEDFGQRGNLSRSYPYSEKDSVTQFCGLVGEQEVSSTGGLTQEQILIESFEGLRQELGRNPEISELLDIGFSQEEIDFLELVLVDIQTQKSVKAQDLELVIA